MKLAADFRAQARQALRGKWPMAVLAGLLAALLGGATQNGPEIKFNLDLGSGTGRASLNYVGRSWPRWARTFTFSSTAGWPGPRCI